MNKELSTNSFPVYTHLKEIYGKDKKEYIEEKISPIYESMRLKFKSCFDNQEPTFYIRIPYTTTLFGDQVTSIFDDKIITTLEKDLIICGKSSGNNYMNIELFDHYSPRTKYDINSSIIEDYPVEHLKYIILAYTSGLYNIKPKTPRGIDLLVNFNISHINNNECKITTFLAVFFAAMHIYNGFKQFNKTMIYDLCVNEINKIANFTNYSSMVYFQLFLDKHSLGFYANNNFGSIKIDPRYI